MSPLAANLRESKRPAKPEVYAMILAVTILRVIEKRVHGRSPSTSVQSHSFPRSPPSQDAFHSRGSYIKVTDVSPATHMPSKQLTPSMTTPVAMRPLLINHRRSGERLVGLLLTLLMLLVPLLSVAQTTSLPLVAGQQLERDQQYNSPDGSHFLIFQGDGNLVVARTADKGFVWGLNTVGGIEFQRAAKVGMDASGHLYANEDDDAVVWLTPNEGAREGSTLNLTDSANCGSLLPTAASHGQAPMPPARSLKSPCRRSRMAPRWSEMSTTFPNQASITWFFRGTAIWSLPAKPTTATSGA